MQNSKLNSVLLVIVIILLAVGIWMLAKKNNSPSDNMPVTTSTNNPENPAYQPNAGLPQIPQSNSGDWVSTTTTGLVVSYNSNWVAAPWYYGSPAQQAQGQSDLVGYKFTLPSGSIIQWGGPQSSCTVSQFGAFQYGVSTEACIQGMEANLIPKNVTPGVSAQPSQADMNFFGDFVQHNQ